MPGTCIAWFLRVLILSATFMLGACASLNMPISQEKPNILVEECIRFRIEKRKCIEDSIRDFIKTKNIPYIDALETQGYVCSKFNSKKYKCIYTYIEKWYEVDYSSFRIETWIFEATVDRSEFRLDHIIYSYITEGGKRFGPIKFRSLKEQDEETQKIRYLERGLKHG